MILGQRALTRRRYNAQARSATTGRLNPRTYTDAAFTGSWQPAPADVIERLPDGERAQAVYEVITTTPLRTSDVGGQTPADVVVVDGDEWQVRHVEDWTAAPMLRHYMALVTRRAVTK